MLGSIAIVWFAADLPIAVAPLVRSELTGRFDFFRRVIEREWIQELGGWKPCMPSARRPTQVRSPIDHLTPTRRKLDGTARHLMFDAACQVVPSV